MKQKLVLKMSYWPQKAFCFIFQKLKAEMKRFAGKWPDNIAHTRAQFFQRASGED